MRGRARHPRLMIIGSIATALRFGSVAVSIRHAQALPVQGARAYGRRTRWLLALVHPLFSTSGHAPEGLWRGTQPTSWTTVGRILSGLSVLALVRVWRGLHRLGTVTWLMASDYGWPQSALCRGSHHPHEVLTMFPAWCGLALIMGAWLVLVLGLPWFLLVLRRRIIQEKQVRPQHCSQYATRLLPRRAQDPTLGHPSA